MASMKLSNQVSSSSTSRRNHVLSRAQMSLKKILDFISSHSANIEFKSEVNETEVVLSCGKRGFDIDLNLRLGHSGNENKGFSACSGVGEDDVGQVSVVFGDVSTGDKSSEGECDPKELMNSTVVVENETRELSEITYLRVPSSEIEAKQQSEKLKRQEEEEVGIEVEQLRRRKPNPEGYLNLLVEAARLISGNFDEDTGPSEIGRLEDKTKESQSTGVPMGLESNGNEDKWMVECGGFEDISPVVRSKRGRNQVLPYRYRDSVLEPWKTLSRTRRTSRVSAAKQRNR